MRVLVFCGEGRATNLVMTGFHKDEIHIAHTCEVTQIAANVAEIYSIDLLMSAEEITAWRSESPWGSPDKIKQISRRANYSGNVSDVH